MAVQFEYNRFFPTVGGDKGEHVKAICDSFEELKTAMAQVNSLFQIEPEDIPFGDIPYETQPPPRAAARPTPQQGQRPNQGVTCGLCGGATWDNREKKAKGDFGATSPDYTCKDKENCNARMWLKKDGTLGDFKLPAL